MRLTGQTASPSRDPRAINNKDSQYSVEITRVIFRIIGVWPLPDGSSRFHKFLQWFQNVTCYFLLLFLQVPATMQIFLVESQLHIRLKIFGSVLSSFVTFTKYTILLWKPSQIANAIKNMNEHWLNASDNEDRRILLSKAILGRKFVTFMVTLVYSGSIPHCILVPLSKGRIQLPNNTTFRVLPCPSYYLLFDEQVSPIYELVFILQVLSSILSCTGVCSPCGLAACFVLHTCGLLRILINRIHDITSGEELTEESIRQRFAIVIQHQIKVKKFLTDIQDIVEALCLVDIFGSTLILCLTGYFVITDWEHSDTSSMMTYFVFVVSFSVNLFIWCYVGQLLLNEGEDIYESFKTMDWYQLPPKRARDLVIIIAMASAPIKITAKKMMDMSLASFADIMKTSLAYLNFLRTLT